MGFFLYQAEEKIMRGKLEIGQRYNSKKLHPSVLMEQQTVLDFQVVPWSNIRVAPQQVTLNILPQSTIKVTRGDFLVLDNGGNRFIGKVLRINVNKSSLEVQIFIFPQNIIDNEHHIPPLNNTIYNFVAGVPEVVETNQTQWINAQAVVDYAFVFHVESVQSGYYSCHGMDNGYFVRFRMFQRRLRNQQNQLFRPEISILDTNEFLPFLHLSDPNMLESLHHRIYQALTIMKRLIDNMLWTERKYKQGNGVVRSTPTPLSQEGWQYIKYRYSRRGMVIIDRAVKRCYK